MLKIIDAPEMRAIELIHKTTTEIPQFIASLLIGQMGDPAFRSPLYAAWYSKILPEHGPEVPFALTVEAKSAKCAITVPWDKVDAFCGLVGMMVPPILSEVIANPGRRAR